MNEKRFLLQSGPVTSFMWYSRSKFCVQNAPDNELNLLPNVREIIPDLSHFKLMKFVFLFWDFKALESKPLNPAADKHTPPLSCCAVTLQLNLDPVSELLFLGRSGVSQSQFGASRILNSSVCSPYLQDSATYLHKQHLTYSPHLEFGPHSVGPGHQDRVDEACCLQVKQASKASQLCVTPWWKKTPLPLHSFFSSSLSIIYHENGVTSSGGRLGQRLDHVHQLVTGGDVHPAVLIGQPSVRDTVTVSLSTARLTGGSFQSVLLFFKACWVWWSVF